MSEDVDHRNMRLTRGTRAVEAHKRQAEEIRKADEAFNNLGCRETQPGTGCRCGEKVLPGHSRCSKHEKNGPEFISGFSSSVPSELYHGKVVSRGRR